MKAAEIFTLHDVKYLRSNHPGIKRLKRQKAGHSAHGNKIWLSSLVLIDYLYCNPIARNSKVLDVGCGWGVNSIFLSKNCAAAVTALDIDPGVEPYLALHCEINQTMVDFRCADFRNLTKIDLCAFSNIVAADICFWDELVEPLYQFINLALNAGVEGLLIADPGRPPFWTLCDLCCKNLGAEILTRRISEPVATEKFILKIELQ